MLMSRFPIRSFTAQLVGNRLHFGGVGRDVSGGNGHAEASQEVLGLVFVKLHERNGGYPFGLWGAGGSLPGSHSSIAAG